MDTIGWPAATVCRTSVGASSSLSIFISITCYSRSTDYYVNNRSVASDVSEAGPIAGNAPSTGREARRNAVRRARSIVRSFRFPRRCLSLPLPTIYVLTRTPVGIFIVVEDEFTRISTTETHVNSASRRGFRIYRYHD